MAGGFASNAFANDSFSTDGGVVTPPPILPPAALAELYGGGLLHGKKKRRLEEVPLDVMVDVIGREPEGKIELIRALPKPVQRHYPDPQIVALSALVVEIESASQRVYDRVEQLYREYLEAEDAEEDDILFLLM